MTTEPPTILRLRWLGQAGFLMPHGESALVIDPYLSDSLAAKYAGTLFQHERLYPAPVEADQLDCDAVICTHRHTDHMDAQTLRQLAAVNPELRIFVPRSALSHAVQQGLAESRLIGMSAGVPFEPIPGVEVLPIPSAHEGLEVDEEGEHRFLGVIVSVNGRRFYHSGDCVPYAGQEFILRREGVEFALLPVNGRDSYRLRHGVPGNFFIDEAIELCEQAGIGTLVGHHFGLFAFNTVEPEQLDRAVETSLTDVRWVRPEVGEWLTLS